MVWSMLAIVRGMQQWGLEDGVAGGLAGALWEVEG